jgi:hypothetical protein
MTTTQDRRAMDGDETLSPVDLPGDPAEDGHALRWASIAIAVAAAFLLLTNAVTIDEWANDLPPSAAAARLTEATAPWASVTERAGLATPRAAVHRLWKRGEALSFAGGEGAASPADDRSPPSP